MVALEMEVVGRVDVWLLVEVESPKLRNGEGMGRGAAVTRSGPRSSANEREIEIVMVYNFDLGFEREVLKRGTESRKSNQAKRTRIKNKWACPERNKKGKSESKTVVE